MLSTCNVWWGLHHSNTTSGTYCSSMAEQDLWELLHRCSFSLWSDYEKHVNVSVRAETEQVVKQSMLSPCQWCSHFGGCCWKSSVIAVSVQHQGDLSDLKTVMAALSKNSNWWFKSDINSSLKAWQWAYTPWWRLRLDSLRAGAANSYTVEQLWSLVWCKFTIKQDLTQLSQVLVLWT